MVISRKQTLKGIFYKYKTLKSEASETLNYMILSNSKLVVDFQIKSCVLQLWVHVAAQYPDLQVGHGMVPPEQTGCDEIGHDYVHAVVLMGHQDADHTHGTQQPAYEMVPPKRPRRV